jgi:hypothetical protein
VSFHSIALSWFGAAACSAATLQNSTPGDQPGVIAVEQGEDRGPLGIAPRYLPPAGECRLWLPGRPPDSQAAAGPCERIEPQALGGSWVLYRPPDHRELIHVRVIDPRRVGIVVATRIYEAEHGTYLGREGPR